MSKRLSRIIGSGAYVPPNLVTNDDLAKRIDTNDEWIVTRTGIKQRYVAGEGETTTTMAYQAALRALEAANLSANDIDMIVLATTTPDNIFPSVATQVQAMLGMTKGAAFDVQAVCSGFVYALAVADNFIRLQQAEKILVIGAESMSKILDWNDRSTCVLFGDGAGAVVLAAETNEERGILATKLYSDGSLKDILFTDGGIAKGNMGTISMSGKEVFKHAVEKMSSAIESLLQANQLTVADIDYLVPHQANVRIIDGIGRKLGLKAEQVIITVDKHANTSAASIPLALDSALKQNTIKPGDIVVFTALGGGITWGAVLIKW
ncbi:MAG: ketoacyl-ACP synthase III [Alphaproteobacteria bacterium]|nr:ketoacyl-ACP synthase III [Alphaproteobacteria bacterium]